MLAYAQQAQLAAAMRYADRSLFIPLLIAVQTIAERLDCSAKEALADLVAAAREGGLQVFADPAGLSPIPTRWWEAGTANLLEDAVILDVSLRRGDREWFIVPNLFVHRFAIDQIWPAPCEGGDRAAEADPHHAAQVPATTEELETIARQFAAEHPDKGQEGLFNEYRRLERRPRIPRKLFPSFDRVGRPRSR